MAKGKKTGGRKKGTPNKTTALLKDAILMAAQEAGGGTDDGLMKYLTYQATESPAAFMSLLGKVLPIQVANAAGEDFNVVHTIELVAPVVDDSTSA